MICKIKVGKILDILCETCQVHKLTYRKWVVRILNLRGPKVLFLQQSLMYLNVIRKRILKVFWDFRVKL